MTIPAGAIAPTEEPMIGARIAPDVWTEGGDMFAAFGKPVPLLRQAAAFDQAKEIGCTGTARIMLAIDKASQQIERDRPHLAMHELSKIVDLTGVYRLLAYLCCPADGENDK